MTTTNMEALREKFRAQAARAPIVKAAAVLTAQQQRLARFEAAHPDIVAWWTGSTFPFAVSLREQLQNRPLTENQIIGAKKCVAALARRAAEPKPACDASGIAAVFETAIRNGVKHPKLRLDGFTFSPAMPDKPNAGAIYAKTGKGRREDTYLGKVMAGAFQRSRDCSEQQQEAVIAAASRPLEAAIAYGRKTGECAICGRTLDNAESIARGIGPICAEKFGF